MMALSYDDPGVCLKAVRDGVLMKGCELDQNDFDGGVPGKFK